MTSGEVYGAVTTLPANQLAGVVATEEHKTKRKLFAQALLALVPEPRRSSTFKSYIECLESGAGYAGAAARYAVWCGADPLVVVTTARLILS